MKNSGMLVFLGIGFELFALVVGSLIIGAEIDKEYKSNGLYTAGLLFICFIAWIVHFVFLLKKYQEDLEKNEADGLKKSSQDPLNED